MPNRNNATGAIERIPADPIALAALLLSDTPGGELFRQQKIADESAPAILEAAYRALQHRHAQGGSHA